MNIVQINAFDYGSTGKIMLNIAKVSREKGNNATTFSTIVFSVNGADKKKQIDNHFYFGSFFQNFIHYVLAQLTDFNGFFSFFSTLTLIKKIKKLKPDIIHLHNLHEFCICLPLLINYIKNNQIKLIWTMHDCWAFTGHCTYFDFLGCKKWQCGCDECPRGKVLPKSRVSNSKLVWKFKKRLFTSVQDMTIVTPSKWLANLVKQSFLKDYPVKVINNGIDLEVFKPTKSDFRKKHDCENKFVLLGVAFGWGERKGLDVFIELSRRLDDRFKIVLVGTDDNVDKLLPDTVISIHRTNDQRELAEIYTAADLFVNPTREEVLGMVNIESLACGTPVVTFNTGGSPECIDETCGSVVEKNDVKALYEEIMRIYVEKPYTKENCLKRAKEFDMNERFKEYINLYERCIND